MTYLKSFIISSFSLLMLGLAQAQEPISVRLSAVSLDGRILDAKYMSGDKVESLYVFRKQRSSDFDYTGPQTFSLYRETEALDEEGEPIRKVVAQTKIPGTSGQYLMIFSKIPGDEERYNILTVPDNWSDFAAGTYRFLNLAPFQIALKIKDEVYQIQERDYTDVTLSSGDNEHHQAMMVSLPDGAEPLTVFRGHIYYTSDRRMLYLITPKAGGRKGRVNFTAIPDVVKEQPVSSIEN